MKHQIIFGQKINSKKVDFKFKGILIGDKGVGKTSIIKKLSSFYQEVNCLDVPLIQNIENTNFYVIIEDKLV